MLLLLCTVCMLLVVNHCKGHSGVLILIFHMDIKKNKEKHGSFALLFKTISLRTQLCQCLLVGTLPAGIPSYSIIYPSYCYL